MDRTHVFQVKGGGVFSGVKMWVFTPLKWLNLPFVIYLLLYWCYQPQNFLVRQKYICFEKQNFLWWETKNDKKKFEFGKLKIPNPDIWPFWEIFNFSNSNFLCHFWFPIIMKKNFFLKANILLSYQNILWDDSVIEKKIFYKR